MPLLSPMSVQRSERRWPARRGCPRILASFLSLVLIAFAAGSVAAAADTWQGREEIRDGILHVMNPAEPAAGTEDLRPRELWRLGGESEAEEEIFGRILSILIDEKGEIYLLDGQLNEVRVFSPAGTYLRSLGRAGEGPGEFSNATTFFFLDGMRLGVAQIMPSRIVVLDRESGHGYADIPLPKSAGSVMSLVEQAEGRSGRVVMSLMSPIMAPDGLVTRRSLTALNGEGEGIGDLKVVEEKQGHGGMLRLGGDETENWFSNWSLGADGRVFVAPFHKGYRIHVLGRDGAEDRVIERAYESLARSGEEMSRLKRQSEDVPEFGGARVEQPVFDHHRDVAGLYPRDDGSLWVLTSRGRFEKPAGALGVFDVFDSQGRFQRRLTLFADYEEDYDDFMIQDNRLFVIKEAKTVAGSTASSGSEESGMMMVVRRAEPAAGDDDEAREALPLEVVCYELGS